MLSRALLWIAILSSIAGCQARDDQPTSVISDLTPFQESHIRGCMEYLTAPGEPDRPRVLYESGCTGISIIEWEDFKAAEAKRQAAYNKQLDQVLEELRAMDPTLPKKPSKDSAPAN